MSRRGAGPEGVLRVLPAEAQRALGPKKGHDQIRAAVLDPGHLRPGDTQIHGAAELKPGARENEMAYLIRLAPPESDGQGEVAPVVGTARACCLKWRRHITRPVLNLATHEGVCLSNAS